MKVFSIAQGFHKVWKDSVENDLSEKERNRLRAITLWQASRGVGLVCDTFGMSRATLYRWVRRYDPKETPAR